MYKGFKMKKRVILSIGLGLLLFTGCGSSSSSSTPETHNERGNGAANAVDGRGNADDAAGRANAVGGQQEVGEILSPCPVDGNIVIVNEGSTCTDGNHIVSCQNNIVTYDNAIHAQTVNMNGRKYTCN